MSVLGNLFSDYTLRTVATGALLIGVISGAVGSFAVLRRQSLLGDAMAHAALPGVVLTYMLTGLKSPVALMVGAAVACIAGVLLILAITRTTRVKEDASLGIILSVFFGFGLMLLSALQRDPDARQAGLNKFLFGQAATLLASDVVAMAIFGGIALALLVLFWKEFKLLSFDRDFAASLGLRVQALEILLTLLLVIAIVLGLQAVGVVLMSAMVVAPAAAARQWTDRLGLMVLLAAIFGAASGVTGTVVSGLASGLSTGPVIVLCISAVAVGSLLLAPHRGVLWSWIRRRRTHARLQAEQVLATLLRLESHHDAPGHPHATAALRLFGAGDDDVRAALRSLVERGLVTSPSPDTWALTSAGAATARRALQDKGEMQP